MSSLNVGGATSARWAEKDWPTSSRKNAVERATGSKARRRPAQPRAAGHRHRALHQPGAHAAGLRGRHAGRAQTGVTVRSLDQLAPKADRNPWNPAADRKSINGYDHIMESLRTAALKRDAALAGSSSTAMAQSATADTAATSATPAADTTTSATAQLAYVRNALAAYARNSALTPTTPE